jgi:hypothetical protein
MGGTCCRKRMPDQLDVGNKCNVPLPGLVVNGYLQAINYAEEITGQPGTLAEIQAAACDLNNFAVPIKKGIAITGFIFEILREDLLYTDPKCHRFTTRPREGYCTFSQNFNKKSPGYRFDTMQRCIPRKEK